VLSVLTFRTPEEAVAKANNTKLRTRVRHMEREGEPDALGRRATPGRRHLGQYVQRFDPTSPLADARVGFGREGGRHGLEAYLNV